MAQNEFTISGFKKIFPYAPFPLKMLYLNWYNATDVGNLTNIKSIINKSIKQKPGKNE